MPLRVSGKNIDIGQVLRTRIDETAMDLWLRSTLCFRREPDGWQIVHAHSSVPFHPGPEPKAAVNLKPQPPS